MTLTLMKEDNISFIINETMTFVLQFFISFLFFQVSLLAQDSTFFDINPPEGFESLLEPQQTIADIFFGGDFIGTAPVTFTAEWLVFDSLEELMQLLPPIKNREGVQTTLGNKLPIHAHLLCERQGQENCGYVDPQIVGIIFDQNRLKVELFFAPDILEKKSAGSPEFFESSQKSLSGILTLQGTVQEVVQSGPTGYTLNGSTVISQGASRLRALTRYSNSTDDPFYTDEVVLETDQKRWRYSLGLLNSQVHPLIPQQELLGFRSATTLDTRKNPDQRIGSEVSLFLQRRSYVSILRGKYLLATFFLPAGHHSLDTSGFPQGSYEILIKINEVGGGQREERRYYSKSQNIPPRQEPQFFLEVGRLQDTANFQNKLVFTPHYISSLSGNFRLTDNLSFQQGWMWGRGRHYFFDSLFLLLKNQQLTLGGLFSGHGDLGVNLAHYLEFGPFYTSLGFSKIQPHIKYQKRRDVGVIVAEEDSFTSTNVGVGLGLSWISLTLRSQYYKNFQNVDTYSYGPRADIPLVRKNNFRLNFENEVTYYQWNRENLAESITI